MFTYHGRIRAMALALLITPGIAQTEKGADLATMREEIRALRSQLYVSRTKSARRKRASVAHCGLRLSRPRQGRAAGSLKARCVCWRAAARAPSLMAKSASSRAALSNSRASGAHAILSQILPRTFGAV